MGSSHQNVKAIYLHDDEISDPIMGTQNQGPIQYRVCIYRHMESDEDGCGATLFL